MERAGEVGQGLVRELGRRFHHLRRRRQGRNRFKAVGGGKERISNKIRVLDRRGLLEGVGEPTVTGETSSERRGREKGLPLPPLFTVGRRGIPEPSGVLDRRGLHEAEKNRLRRNEQDGGLPLPPLFTVGGRGIPEPSGVLDRRGIHEAEKNRLRRNERDR
ncbi:unnamed protein product [Musa hybrid cultivar]